jgi:hypothetical protein
VTGLGKLIRALIGVVVLVALIVTVNSWYGQYRESVKRSKLLASRQDTSTVAASATPVPVVPFAGAKIAILVDGAALRSAPATATKSIRGLKKGELLFFLTVAPNNWIKVRDAKGKQGFMLNDPAVARVQK